MSSNISALSLIAVCLFSSFSQLEKPFRKLIEPFISLLKFLDHLSFAWCTHTHFLFFIFSCFFSRYILILCKLILTLNLFLSNFLISFSQPENKSGNNTNNTTISFSALLLLIFTVLNVTCAQADIFNEKKGESKNNNNEVWKFLTFTIVNKYVFIINFL